MAPLQTADGKELHYSCSCPSSRFTLAPSQINSAGFALQVSFHINIATPS